MSRQPLGDALQRTELDFVTLGELASAAIKHAVHALVSRDDTLAQQVIEGDDEIDELYLRIDSDTISLLALQTPVASDLRLVSAMLHGCLHLERIGDQAVNIAKLYLLSGDIAGGEGMRSVISEMGDRVVSMISTAMEAFVNRDVERCLELPVMDDLVDRLNRTSHLEALKLADDKAAIEWGMHMNLAARALERAGDNAVDIGEQIGYLVTGEFREFTDASHQVES
jgi:phosphate transport system protein